MFLRCGFPAAVFRLWSPHQDLECCNLVLSLSLEVLLKWRASEVSLSPMNVAVSSWLMCWEFIWSLVTWKGRKGRLYVGACHKKVYQRGLPVARKYVEKVWTLRFKPKSSFF